MAGRNLFADQTEISNQTEIKTKPETAAAPGRNLFATPDINQQAPGINQQAPDIMPTAPGAIDPKIKEALLQKLVAGDITDSQLEALNELSKRGKLSEKLGFDFSNGYGKPISTMQHQFGDVPETSIEGFKKVTREALPYVIRPVLETVPAVGMGMAGTPGGPMGQAAGGAIGYAAGKTAADRIEKWAQPEGPKQKESESPIIDEMGTLANDLLRGLTFEFGGAIAGQILGAILKVPGFVKGKLAERFPAMTPQEIEKRAAQIIAENTGSHPQYLKNIEASKEVMEEIPGLKASAGEIADDPNLIKMQRGLETGDSIGSEVKKFKEADNLDAINNYLTEQFPGNENIIDVVDILSKQKTALKAGKEAAEDVALKVRGKVEPETPQATGKKVSEEIQEAFEPMQKEEAEYWKKVPDYEMDVVNAEKMFRETVNEPSIAQEVVQEYHKIFNARPKTVKNMQVIDQELGDGIYDPQAKPTIVRALTKLKIALSKDFDTLGKAAREGDFATVIDKNKKIKIVHPKQLESEMAIIDKNLADEAAASGTKEVVDTERVLQELKESKKIGIMRQVAESEAEWSKRIAKDYERFYKKKPPTIPGTDSPRASALKAQKEGIENILKTAKPARDAGTAYAEAKKFSEIENFDRFGKGVVAELTKRGKYEGGKRIPHEKRPLKLMSVDSADQFIKALGGGEVGKQKAGDIMIRHYADDMLNSNKVKYDEAGQLQPKSLTNWFNKHKRVLDRYGIKEYFENVDNAHATMGNAQKAAKEFDKSIASKMIGSDPQNAIAQAMSGGEGISAKNTAKIMGNLLDKVKGDKRGKRALENAFKDFMMDSIKTTFETAKGGVDISKAGLVKSLRRFKPAMAVLYKDNPKKIKALQSVEKALIILNRSAKSPAGRGPDTAEKGAAIASVIGNILSRTPGVGYGLRLGGLGLGAFKNLNIKETNDMIIKMLHDPDLAQIIIRASTKNPNVKKISKDFNRYLMTTGLRKAEDMYGIQEKTIEAGKEYIIEPTKDMLGINNKEK